MSYRCCSGNFSSRSLGGYISYPVSSCGSSYPSNLVYTTDLCSPSTCQLGSSVSTGCQETCCEPSSCQTSCVVSSPCLPSCSRPRTSVLCSPCQTTYTGSLGCRSNSSCSGNFSRSLGGYISHPVSSCGSSYPSNLVYTTDLCSPSTCQLGSSVSTGCQETCCEPSSCQTSCAVSSPCLPSCSRPRTSVLCSPCQTTYTGSLGCRSNSSCSLGCGPRSYYSLGCGSRSFSLPFFGSYGFRSLGYGDCGFPSLSWGSRFYYPTYFGSRSCQSSCYGPTCGPILCRSTC